MFFFPPKKKEFSRPRGTQDIFYPRSDLFSWIYQKAKNILERNNFSLIVFPTFEKEEIFSSVFSSSSVSRQMYKFFDKKERALVLRPEGTLSAARLIIQNNLIKNSFPQKFFYWANMFRYERPQEGRYREFWQLGGEVVGFGENVFSDFYLIEIVYELLKSFSFSSEEFVFIFNYLGSEDTQNKYEKKLLLFLEGKESDLCQNCQIRWKKNPLRILDCLICQKKWIFPVLKEELNNSELTHISSLKKLFDSTSIPYKFDDYLVRGLDYYTGLVFEVYLLNEKKAIAGGGRYDRLYWKISDRDIPSLGFSFGIDRVINYLLSKKKKISNSLPKLDVFFLIEDFSFLPVVLQWKNRLVVEEKISVEYEVNLEEINFLEKEFQEQKAKIFLLFTKELWKTEEVLIKTPKTNFLKICQKNLLKKIRDYMFILKNND